jgi:hypothetical protein
MLESLVINRSYLYLLGKGHAVGYLPAKSGPLYLSLSDTRVLGVYYQLRENYISTRLFGKPVVR